MAVLKIIGWKEGIRKTAIVKLLRERLGLNFFQAKSIIDDVLDGKTIFLNINYAKTAEILAEELFDLGAIVKVEE